MGFLTISQMIIEVMGEHAGEKESAIALLTFAEDLAKELPMSQEERFAEMERRVGSLREFAAEEGWSMEEMFDHGPLVIMPADMEESEGDRLWCWGKAVGAGPGWERKGLEERAREALALLKGWGESRGVREGALRLVSNRLGPLDDGVDSDMALESGKRAREARKIAEAAGEPVAAAPRRRSI